MKRLLIILSAVAVLTLTACGNNNDEIVTTTTTAATTTEQEEVTTTTPVEVEDITTTTVTDEVTTEITTIPEEVTTEATTTTEAAPAWVDEALPEATMYATTACYVRKDAVVGSDALYVVAAGKAVTIVGKTDTGYYKLSDGGYIHSDYLSNQKPLEEVVTTTAPVEQDTPTTITTASTPEYELPPYNHTNATCNGIEIVLTEEDAEAINNEIFRLTNELRVSLGLNELQRHPKLDMIARVRAYELTICFSHNRPDGSLCHTVCQEFDFGNGMGENIAACIFGNRFYIGSDGKYHPDIAAIANAAFNGWKNSSGHYENMINPTYKYLSIDIDVASAKTNMTTLSAPKAIHIFAVQNFKS